MDLPAIVEPSHVHIGTGKLGLGLIGDIAADLRLSTLFLNRKHPSSEERNQKLLHDRSYVVRHAGDATPKLVAGFQVGLFDENNPRSPAFDAIAQPAVRLLTISVGWENVRALVEPLAYGINRRFSGQPDSSAPLYIIACENRQRASEVLGKYVSELAHQQELAAAKEALARRQVIFCNAVVDRVCPSIDLHPGAPVSVTVERYRKWVIHRSGDTALLEGMLGSDGAIEFTDRIEPHEKLKLWGLNGLHLIVAILARHANPPIDLISDAVDSPHLQSHIHEAAGEIAEALLLEFPSDLTREYVEDFMESAVRRFREARRDRSSRILKDLELDQDRVEQLVSEGLRQISRVFMDRRPAVEVMEETLRRSIHRAAYVFVGKVNDRLGEPVAVLQKHHRPAPYLLNLFPQIIFLMDQQGRNLSA